MATFTQYKDKNNKRKWQYDGYVATCPLTGKKIVTTRRGFDTKGDAQRDFEQFKAEIIRGVRKPDSMTFEELYNKWLEQHRKSVKPSTVATNRRFIEGHVLPKFGKLELDKITVSYCQKCVNEWHSEFKQYQYMRRAAAQVMEYGIAMEWMESNPMKKTILPRKLEDDKAPNFYTKDELKQFLDFVRTLDNYKYYAFFRLLALTGMRKSEALALSIDDVDFFNKTLTIGKTIAIDEFGKIILQTPKTKSSYRTISLDIETIKILQNWIGIQKKEFFMLGIRTKKKDQLLFSNQSNDLYYPQVVNDWLDWIYKKAKQADVTLKKITPHGFRHTACSLMFESGATINDVQKRLGHKDVKTTMNIYSHVTPQQAENTSQRLANYLGF